MNDQVRDSDGDGDRDGDRDAITRRRALGALAAAATALAAGCPWRHRHDPEVIRARMRAIGARFGVVIAYGPPESFFVAPYTRADARIAGGAATSADVTALPAALDGVEQALAVYPPGFVARRCRAIFFCGSLRLDGAQAGGTYGPAWIVLVAAHAMGDASIFETARLGVHHELSSLFWAGDVRLGLRWRALLPAGWRPAATNADALAAARADTPAPAARDDGFLSAYGATSAENDFNVYAETIFTDAARVARLARALPVVAHKAALLMERYTADDARMAAVFDGLGLGDVRRAPPAAPAPVEIGGGVSPIAIPSGKIVRAPD